MNQIDISNPFAEPRVSVCTPDPVARGTVLHFSLALLTEARMGATDHLRVLGDAGGMGSGGQRSGGAKELDTNEKHCCYSVRTGGRWLGR